MFELKDCANDPSFQSRRCSTSTIDSDTAAEIVKAYENKDPATKIFNSTNPKVHNTMTFDKSDGIHVGDVINYYCSSSPSYQVSNHSHHNEYEKSQSTTHSEATLISSFDSKESKICAFISQKSRLLLLIAISLIIVVITSSIFFLMRHKPINIDMTETTTIKIITSTLSQVEIDSTTTLSDIITTTTTAEPTTPTIITLESFVSRAQWDAEAPKATVYLKLPIYRIIIAQTGSESCESELQCTKFVRELQKNSTQLDDLPFNFLIGSDSKVYEGRGFSHQGQHTSNNYGTEFDSIGICVAFIGNYESQKLAESQINVFHEFIEYFKDLGIINQNYTVFLQDDLIKTEISAIGLEQTVESWQGFRKLQKVHHRSEWAAEKPKLQENLNLPIDWSIITSTAGYICNNFTSCASTVKNMQSEAFNDSHNDIEFAFIIGGDGLIFEGRGWDYIGQHTPNFDTKTVAICVIGTYGVVDPSSSVLNATYNLIEDGAALGKLTDNYKVNGRQELAKNLTGPGGNFVKIIRTWKHWHYLPIPKKYG